MNRHEIKKEMKRCICLFWLYVTNLWPSRLRLFRKHYNNYRRNGCICDKDKFFYSPKHKVGYITIEKVMSTSIKTMFLNLYQIPTDRRHDRHDRTFYCPNPPQDMNFSFAFVRNPFSRFVVNYKNQYSRASYGVFDKYAFGLLLGRHRVKNFQDFLKKTLSIPEKFRDDHLVSQYTFLYDEDGSCRVDFIGKIENAQQDWAYIQERTGLPDLPHINKTVQVDWRDFYNLDLAELVYNLYREDFEVFGYQEEYDRLIKHIKNRSEKTSGPNWWEISPLAKNRYPRD